jgi:hypothetical protein
MTQRKTSYSDFPLTVQWLSPKNLSRSVLPLPMDKAGSSHLANPHIGHRTQSAAPIRSYSCEVNR